ncbi:hypothetical protein EVJ50_12140 [Synechococcus sp. RSCCF101]|nr:hypothetical protein EVJ50_12140 [Synechococcus sp. RSCCF101]
MGAAPLYALYDQHGLLRCLGSDGEACEAYASLFGLAPGSWSVMQESGATALDRPTRSGSSS